MKNIEKALISYVNGKGPRVSYGFLCSSASERPKELIDIHFKLISQELDALFKTRNVEKAIVLLENLNVMIANCDSLNRDLIRRGILKLNERIDRITIEDRNKLIKLVGNYGQLVKKLQRIRVTLDNVEELTDGSESKPYDFVIFLVDIIRDTGYIEYTLERMPNLVNVNDKNQVSLFRIVMNRCIESIRNYDDESLFYYRNIISLIISHDRFILRDKEKHQVLNDIYKGIDKMSINKKELKKNKEKIEWLNNITSIIRGLGDNQTDIESIAAKYKVPVSFDEFITTAAKLAQPPRENEKDRYYVDDYILSIDESYARQIDDALSCKKLSNGNYLLGVHIASVLSYFDYETDIVQEALSRVKAIYLNKNYQFSDEDYKSVIPTLPYEFSAKTGSLLPDAPKYARSFYFEIDKDGDIVNEKFIKSIIKNNKKSSYYEVDKILKHGTDDEPLQNTITALEELCEILDKVYKPSYLYEKIKESNKDTSDLRVKRKGAQKIVYLTMLLTGNRVAEYFTQKGYPCLYRVHEVNESNNKKLEAMIKNLTETYGGDKYEKLYQLLLGIYPKGWYAMEGSHYGLGLDHYCHCTSNLRRSADIVVEHALDVCYENNPDDKELMRLEDEIKKRVREINSRIDPIDWFANDYARTYQKRR